MAKGKKGSSGNKSRNDERKCGKASKQHPGVAPGAHNGHSVGGYSIKKHGLHQAQQLAQGNRDAA